MVKRLNVKKIKQSKVTKALFHDLESKVDYLHIDTENVDTH